ncbi:hypothetical protein [Pseudomaricurvus sp. HS19]|uniref:hypothetical protein n=1 Tax=Pseudomaricurvus sp. HS19 TaxID=2692626 RepID=UPI001371EC5A|nr:hypothetical protein [Pseudomaricurvus sp. HS19]MYM63410.1 hypothetical protein [Pseudomaricurvus sp. HS19]
MTTKLTLDISKGILEVEGSEKFVYQIYTDFKNALASQKDKTDQTTPEPHRCSGLNEEASSFSETENTPQPGTFSGHYRETSDDYSIKVGGGSIYIKPLQRGLVITAHPKSEHLLTSALGTPSGRDSPNSINYAKWEILKDTSR